MISLGRIGLTGPIGPVGHSLALCPISPIRPIGPIFAQVQTTDQLEDIRPPYFYLHPWLWTWVLLAVICAILIAVILWFILRPPRVLSPASAYDLALAQLEKARGLLREDNAMPYSIAVSETVRAYLGHRFGAPSTRRTTEEFLRQMEADRTSHLADYREQLRHFLQACDLVKFAKYQPTLTELEQVHQRATNFVLATKPPPPQNGR